MRSLKFWFDGYNKFVLNKPKTSLFILFSLLIVCSFFIKNFRMDASSDSLTLEHDEDLRYYQSISERFGSGEFVFVTFTPKGDLLSPPSLELLRSLREDLRGINGVSEVVTLLDIPLLKNPPGSLSDLPKNVKTIEGGKADIEMARKELGESPIYQNLLVSPDLKSTALQVKFPPDLEHQKLLKRRNVLREIKRQGPLTASERLELTDVEIQHRRFKDQLNEKRHQAISDIRDIIAKYQGEARFFIGGVPMIIDDILSFIRNDLVFFGLGMLVFLVLALSIIFRGQRWVFLPMLCCLTSAGFMLGLLGFLHWDVTVVSSNFISLQLIFTMSLAIHIVVRFRELMGVRPEASKEELVKESVRLTFVPCLYASLTTIAGFTSLVISDILPVVNFGWMMTLGLCISLIVTFVLLPSFLILLPKPNIKKEKDFGLPLTSFFARLTENKGRLILGVSGLFLVLTTWGVSRLEVENSFIDYFKESTDIYRGMKFIDDELGGTTPLDIMVSFGSSLKEEESNTPSLIGAGRSEEESAGDSVTAEFDEFEEFDVSESEDSSKYWFTQSKFEVINRVHNYLEKLPATGKVLSLATLEKTVRDLNGNEPLDNFTLALIFNEIDDDAKKFLVDPYVFLDENQARFSVRIKDSLPGLRRNQLIQKVKHDLEHDLGLEKDRFRVSGLMVLYNNMLQSLFQSQIKTIGYTSLTLLLMFLLLFRSPVVALIAIFPSLLSSLSALGLMGLMEIPLDMMTITIVAIGIGIAVDDTIHYLHRFKEEIVKDGNYTKAMHRCHRSIGNAMYYTSLTITIGFSFLAVSNFVPSILFGLLTALVMVMALIASLTLMPYLVVLFKPFKNGH